MERVTFARVAEDVGEALASMIQMARPVLDGGTDMTMFLKPDL